MPSALEAFAQAALFAVPSPSYSMHSFPDELIWIPWGLDYETCKTGDCFPAVCLRRADARYLVLYLHCNGEDIGRCYSFGCGLCKVLEVHVLLVEYPSYGICSGTCSEETLWETAKAAFRFVTEVLKWDGRDVIVMGRSLGTAVATRLACTFPCNGLVLVAPFPGVVEFVGQYLGGMANLLVSDRLRSQESMRGVTVPTLVIHGMKDRMYHWTIGRQIFDLSPAKKKVFVCPEEMGHNDDLLSNADFLIRPMLRFFPLPDYNFDQLEVPREAFNKRLCPQYHNLMEAMRGETPLSQSQGDQEPCPQCTASDGPEGPTFKARFFPGAAGDLDDLEGPTAGSSPAVRPAISPADVDQLEGPPDADAAADTAEGDSSSTASSSLPRQSASGMQSLPGLQLLNIDDGITRFLNEAPTVELA